MQLFLANAINRVGTKTYHLRVMCKEMWIDTRHPEIWKQTGKMPHDKVLKIKKHKLRNQIISVVYLTHRHATYMASGYVRLRELDFKER